jgi:hypothetical protein
MAGTRSSPPDLADPSTQRNLSDAGGDQARQLGRAIGRQPDRIRCSSPTASTSRERRDARSAEGESAVFSPGDAGRPSLVARITAEEWQRLARQG